MRFTNIFSHSALLFLFLGVFLVSIFSIKSIYLGKTIYGDGIFYYSWLRSIVIDHDISFFNEYAHFGVNQLPTQTGLIGNQFAIGPAVLWFPMFMWIHSIVQGSGYTFIYQYAVGLQSVGYSLVGLVLLYRMFTKYYSNTLSFLTIIAISIGTNLFFYGGLDTVNSHALSFFVSCVLLTLIVEQKRYILMGLAAGLLGAIRIQDSLFVWFPIFYALYTVYQKVIAQKTVVRLSNIVDISNKVIQICLGFSIPILGQFAIWYLLYGDIRIPYLERGYGFNFLDSSFLSVLFSPHNGLFLWTPLVAFACIGLVMKKPAVLQRISYATILFFLWQTYLVGSWSIWWQGASYSGRMFISLLPFISLGGIAILNRFSEKNQSLIVILFCLLNILLSGYYLFIT